jgi:hypothetical protein
LIPSTTFAVKLFSAASHASAFLLGFGPFVKEFVDAVTVTLSKPIGHRLVLLLLRNQQVRGSSPRAGSIFPHTSCTFRLARTIARSN